MKRMMQRLLIGLLLLLPATAAFGQSQTVRQSGPSTAKHASCFVSNGVIGDCGSAAVPFLSSIGTLGQGPTICANSAASTGPYNQLCLAANTASNAQIILQNYGGATAESLDFVINGVVTTFTGSSGGVAGDMACFLTSGSITTCGLAAASGVITSGAWHASAVALLYGGTGATTASGARTNLGLGSMATQDASAVAVTGGTITGMPTPSLASDVAIKSYVDGLASGLKILASSTLATAAVLPNSPTYANGTLGVGATLTAGSNTTLTVDGTAAPLNTVVLVKNQAAAAQNGIYTVSTAGDGSNPWVLTRATYFDQAAEMTAGSYTFITSGATNVNSSYTLATTVATVGSSAVNFNQFSISGSGTLTSLMTGGIVTGGTITTTGTINVNAAITPQGRLTLQTGTPVMTTTVSGATTVYYTPYVGNLVPLYDGTNMVPTAFAEVQQATTDTTKSPSAVSTNANYDIFCWTDSGTNRCTRGPAWTSSTARGTGAGTTELVRVNGIYLNANTISNGPTASRGTYVGTIRSNGSSAIDYIFGAAASGGTAGSFGVWNAYNRRESSSIVIDNGVAYIYDTNTPRQMRASSGMQVSFIRGLDEDIATFSMNVAAEPFFATGGQFLYIGVGLDSTTSYISTAATGFVQTPAQESYYLHAEYKGYPGIGWHTLSGLEQAVNSFGINSVCFGGLSCDNLQFTGLQ